MDCGPIMCLGRSVVVVVDCSRFPFVVYGNDKFLIRCLKYIANRLRPMLLVLESNIASRCAFCIVATVRFRMLNPAIPPEGSLVRGLTGTFIYAAT